MTLLEILTGSISYDGGWAVYAEKVDGLFQPQSEARFGQTVFENGGLLDGFELFAKNDSIVDSICDWSEGDADFVEEAAIQLIEEINDQV